MFEEKEKKWHILVVDDNEENRYFLSVLLSKTGYKVSTATNGKEALEILERTGCDIIVSDILMPEMDGYQLCMEVKFNEKYENIPFIFYTATYTDRKDEEFALKLGADYFLRKPMAPEEFSEKIREVIELVRKNNYMAKRPEIQREEQIFKLYNERLIKKLNKKMKDLEEEIERRKKAEEELKKSEERYALALAGSLDGIWDWDLLKNEIYFSLRWKSMLGYNEEEIENKPDCWFNLIHPDDIDMFKIELDLHLKGEKKHFEVEHRILHKNNTYRWVLTRGLALRDEKNLPVRIAGSQTDITERKKIEEQILHDAFHDSLTGLPNRALFEDRLNQACERAKRIKDYSFSVLHLNLDRFRLINESLGHSTGDKLLINISQKIKNILNPADTLARFGSDEFLILMEDAMHRAKSKGRGKYEIFN